MSCSPFCQHPSCWKVDVKLPSIINETKESGRVNFSHFENFDGTYRKKVDDAVYTFHNEKLQTMPASVINNYDELLTKNVSKSSTSDVEKTILKASEELSTQKIFNILGEYGESDCDRFPIVFTNNYQDVESLKYKIDRKILSRYRIEPISKNPTLSTQLLDGENISQEKPAAIYAKRAKISLTLPQKSMLSEKKSTAASIAVEDNTSERSAGIQKLLKLPREILKIVLRYMNKGDLYSVQRIEKIISEVCPDYSYLNTEETRPIKSGKIHMTKKKEDTPPRQTPSKQIYSLANEIGFLPSDYSSDNQITSSDVATKDDSLALGTSVFNLDRYSVTQSLTRNRSVWPPSLQRSKTFIPQSTKMHLPFISVDQRAFTASTRPFHYYHGKTIKENIVDLTLKRVNTPEANLKSSLQNEQNLEQKLYAKVDDADYRTININAKTISVDENISGVYPTSPASSLNRSVDDGDTLINIPQPPPPTRNSSNPEFHSKGANESIARRSNSTVFPAPPINTPVSTFTYQDDSAKFLNASKSESELFETQTIDGELMVPPGTPIEGLPSEEKCRVAFLINDIRQTGSEDSLSSEGEWPSDLGNYILRRHYEGNSDQIVTPSAAVSTLTSYHDDDLPEDKILTPRLDNSQVEVNDQKNLDDDSRNDIKKSYNARSSMTNPQLETLMEQSDPGSSVNDGGLTPRNSVADETTVMSPDSNNNNNGAISTRMNMTEPEEDENVLDQSSSKEEIFEKSSSEKSFSDNPITCASLRNSTIDSIAEKEDKENDSTVISEKAANLSEKHLSPLSGIQFTQKYTSLKDLDSANNAEEQIDLNTSHGSPSKVNSKIQTTEFSEKNIVIIEEETKDISNKSKLKTKIIPERDDREKHQINKYVDSIASKSAIKRSPSEEILERVSTFLIDDDIDIDMETDSFFEKLEKEFEESVSSNND